MEAIDPHKKMTEEQFISMFTHLKLDECDIKNIKDYYKMYEQLGDSTRDYFKAGKGILNVYALKHGLEILNKQ